MTSDYFHLYLKELFEAHSRYKAPKLALKSAKQIYIEGRPLTIYKFGDSKNTSVIIPTREGLPKNLESAMNQTYRDFQIIVVSGPGAKGNCAMARNIGIKHSPGVRYIAILDDDAYPFPNWLEELVKASRLYPGEVMQSNEINPPSPYFNFKKNFDDFTEISTANFALFPIEVFSTVGLYDEKLIKWGPVEVDFSIRLRKKGFKIRYCRHALIVHKYMPRTLTRYWKGLLMFFAKHPISGVFLIMCYTPIIHNFWDKYINQNPRFEI